MEQARAALGVLGDSYRTQYPEKIDAKSGTLAKPLPEVVTENLRPGFLTLLAAVTFVLLIACSNVANLLLVRFSGRRREISLRMALGASRGSVLRLFVFESVLISLLAGILGAVLAWQLVPLVPRLAGNFLPIEVGATTHLRPIILPSRNTASRGRYNEIRYFANTLLRVYEHDRARPRIRRSFC